MASLLNKIARFASSPQGRRAIQQAKRIASDPKTRQQAKDAFDKVKNRIDGKGSSGGTTGTGDGGTPPPPRR